MQYVLKRPKMTSNSPTSITQIKLQTYKIQMDKGMFLMQKIIIMTHVLCTLNYKKIPTILQVYIVNYVWNWECLLNYVLEIMPYMMDFSMVLMVYLNV
jgi:hypothetical protein